MTQDEIIEMATQVSERNYGRIIFFEFEVEELEAFAKLVAAKAVAELESQEPMATIAVRWHEPVGKVAYVLEVNLPVGVHKLYTHTPQHTEQELVGWIDSKGNMLCVKINESCRPLYTHPPQRTEQEPMEDDFFKMIADSNPKPFPPPQRTWIGLTDDEFNELYDRYVPLTCYALLIEKVEAKLKEKNT